MISTALFRELKKELNAIAFGSAGNRAILTPGPLSHLGTRVDDTAFDAATAFQTEYQASSIVDATLPRTLRVQQTQLVKTSLEKSPSLRPGTLWSHTRFSNAADRTP